MTNNMNNLKQLKNNYKSVSPPCRPVSMEWRFTCHHIEYSYDFIFYLFIQGDDI